LQGGVPSVADIALAIRESRANRMFLTTGLFHLMVDEEPQALGELQELLAGGDVISQAHLSKLAREQSVSIVAVYGPTEATTYATAYRVDAENPPTARVPIGTPIANTEAYILTDELTLAPIGAVGELYLGGPGLARCYRNNAALTAERFVPHPFVAGERLYRTGDLATYLASGDIEFVGRRDGQVKVRGFRVELNEVEAALLDCPQVRMGVVVAQRTASGDKRLVAYYVPSETAAESHVDSVRSLLQERLPAHCVPSVFVPMTSLPLGATGKVDRRGLPSAESMLGEARKELVRPRSAIEQALLEVWQEVLGLKEISIHDDFFALGGDSILSIKIVARASQRGMKLTTRDVFRCATIAALAANVQDVNGTPAEGRLSGDVELTPIQRWFFAQHIPNRNHWNQSFVLKLRGAFSSEVIEQALKALVLHHDALRLRFEETASGIRQVYGEARLDDLLWTIDEAHEPSENFDQTLRTLLQRAEQSLSLASGALLRAVLVTYADGSQKCFVTIHHLVVDGVSWRILIEDFEDALRALATQSAPILRQKTTSLQRWGDRLRTYALSSKLAAEREFWTLGGARPAACPVSYAPEENTEAELAVLSVELSPDETRNLLQGVPKRLRVQINDCLLTALAAALRDWTGSSEQLITLEGHGREELFDDIDLSRSVGWFTSMFPVRLNIDGATSVVDSLKLVKEQLRVIPEKGIGYGVLRHVAEPALVRGDGARPWLSFNYLGQFDAGDNAERLVSVAESHGSVQHDARTVREHLIDVVAIKLGGSLKFDWYYNRALTSAETVRNVAEHCLGYLRALLKECLNEKTSTSYSPSDFAKLELNDSALQNILSQVGAKASVPAFKGRR
jgi:non-ribosomal peptide synthase protein (TIGR01720 family)